MPSAASGCWPRRCYESALQQFPSTEAERLIVLGELGMIDRLNGRGQDALKRHTEQLHGARVYNQPRLEAEALD